MIRRLPVTVLVLGVCMAASATAYVLLPTGWRISPPTGAVATVGLFPQGMALSPDGTRLAVVDSGDGPATLQIVNAQSLQTIRTIHLSGAFGEPIWLDSTRVLVAGANTDAILRVNLRTGTVAEIPIGRGTWPASIALSPNRKTIAASDDGNARVSLVNLGGSEQPLAIPVGAHPSALTFSTHGKTLFVAVRGEHNVAAIDLATRVVTQLPVGRHPDALLIDGRTLFVSNSDDDSIDAIDEYTHKRIARVDLELRDGRTNGFGASPNALALAHGLLAVSLGAENAVALVDPVHMLLLTRIPAGWYPSGVAAHGSRLYVLNAKGESSPANPQYNPFGRDAYGGNDGYVGSSLFGSIRTIDLAHLAPNSSAQVVANAQPRWRPPTDTILHANGPIKHVIYIIKENRTYDEVLGDVAGADGDPSLVWFGQRVTPNQHAIAERFGIFDRTFADAQVSADGHNWSTAAFANDYLERFWPVVYAGRRDLYDFEDGATASRPHNGYLWDDATRAHVSFRDYGEFVTNPTTPAGAVTTSMRNLIGHIDPKYPGFDLDYSDQNRFLEWRSEFRGYVADGSLPQLEIIRLPNDHTKGTRVGALTPQAYVAQNDYALGEIVDTLSHSRYWSSTAIFSIEDDAQNGADHVDDQRTTFFLASPYAAPGVHHDYYSTSSVLHTIELILGLQPMSIYDAVAQPMYQAFDARADMKPYNAIAPLISVNATNARTAYGAAISAKLDFRHADHIDPAIFNQILVHAVHGKL